MISEFSVKCHSYVCSRLTPVSVNGANSVKHDEIQKCRVNRGITNLATNTLPVLVIQSVLSLLPLGRYLVPFTVLNRHQPIDSSGKFFLPMHQIMCVLSEKECLW